MRDYCEYPEWQLKPVRLSINEINNPLPVITEFLAERNLREHREVIWNILQAALEIDSEYAAEWLRYIRELETFIEASTVLSNNLRSDQTLSRN